MAEKANDKREKILLVSKDTNFIQSVKSTFASSTVIEIHIIQTELSEAANQMRNSEAKAYIIDCDANNTDTLETLKFILRMNGATRIPAIIVTEEFSASAVRMMVQLHVSDFLVKPVSTNDLMRSCMKAITGNENDEETEAKVYSFMPASGGVGVTTLALESAFILQNSAFASGATCVVDLNFQQGCCAEYLDLEPHFNLNDIQDNPERLDRQLLEVIISRHTSGLAVISAPYRPSEMGSFDERIVVRLLDLVAAYYDNVIIDMPSTWFPWTDKLLVGSDEVFIVAEMTVPCLRHAQRMLQAIEDKMGNRSNQKFWSTVLTIKAKQGALKNKILKMF